MLRSSLWLQTMPHIQEGRPDISKYFGIFCTLGGRGDVSLSLFQRQLIKYLLTAMLFCLCVSQQGGTMRLWLATYSWQIQNSQQLKQLFLPSKDNVRFGRLMQALNVCVTHTITITFSDIFNLRVSQHHIMSALIIPSPKLKTASSHDYI